MSFLAVGFALFALIFGANLPTPLYLVYRERFGFSAGVLTLVFATYALVLIPSLLVFGQLSDRVGRRPVILGGLAAAALALVVFAAAQDVAWLFVARALQGVAVGATTGTATAALVELEPDGSEARAALAAVLAQAGGSASGPFVAGVLAQWAPAQRQLCYVVGLVATFVAAAAIARIAEPAEPSGEWSIQRPSVPRTERTRFARAGLTAALVWAVAALFLSVVPTYAARLLATHDLALLSGVSAVALAVGCTTQVGALRARLAPDWTQPVALASLGAGLVALVLAFPLESLALVLTAALFVGVALGLGSFGSQTEINELAPRERRGEVTAAYVTVMYAGVAGASIAVGLLSDVSSLFPAVTSVGAVIAAAAGAVGFWHLRARRAR